MGVTVFLMAAGFHGGRLEKERKGTRDIEGRSQAENLPTRDRRQIAG
jgi:hypothetical protein